MKSVWSYADYYFFLRIGNLTQKDWRKVCSRAREFNQPQPFIVIRTLRLFFFFFLLFFLLVSHHRKIIYIPGLESHCPYILYDLSCGRYHSRLEAIIRWELFPTLCCIFQVQGNSTKRNVSSLHPSASSLIFTKIYSSRRVRVCSFLFNNFSFQNYVKHFFHFC